MHWAVKKRVANWDTPSPSGTTNGKNAIISPCLLPPASRGLRPFFALGGEKRVAIRCRSLRSRDDENFRTHRRPFSRGGGGYFASFFFSVSKSPLSRHASERNTKWETGGISSQQPWPTQPQGNRTPSGFKEHHLNPDCNWLHGPQLFLKTAARPPI